jgi:hypothetical protein
MARSYPHPDPLIRNGPYLASLSFDPIYLTFVDDTRRFWDIATTCRDFGAAVA